MPEHKSDIRECSGKSIIKDKIYSFGKSSLQNQEKVKR